ncbi:hypothetical protein [Reichenbachiella ulvae]|uniref:TIGR02646 family protein n=1 Tax=Reichenbachiella ulvae TaxID=2980104 RepID=A0ABT3CQL7_9BACT|nr:hypothetical protein [Reichenbachiella ulvae]MCV9385998.1 hypothetical protein [Reichenbachiella ulvae]
MIEIDRNTIPKPKVLDGTNSKGGKETAKAIAYYSNPFNTKPYKKFSVYRDKEVKEALIKLFKKKCAYCESTFLHVYSGDIEHFRPKGEIDEANPSKPGYYWLAADWDNLLLSCRNCNQKLTHQIHGEANAKTMGKMNQFPLIDPQKYVRSHSNPNGINNEESYRLLLNPCEENPEIHLEYDINSGVIKPKKIDGIPSEKGKKSIEVYVLQRVPLVQAREKVLIEILAQIQRVKEGVKNVNDSLTKETAMQIYFNDILKRELTILKKYMKPTEPYSAMAKQVIGEFMKSNFSVNV